MKICDITDEMKFGEGYEPCYVQKEAVLNYAIAINKPVIVLFGDEAVRNMADFVKVIKNKDIFRFNDKLSKLMCKIGASITVLSVITGAPAILVKNAIDVAIYGFIIRLLNNTESYKNYNILIDEVNDRAIFVLKDIEDDKYKDIVDNIDKDFLETTEIGNCYKNISRINEIYHMSKGNILVCKIMNGEFLVGDEIKIIDDNMAEYGTIGIVGMEMFRSTINVATVGMEVGFLVSLDDELENIINKNKILGKYLYIVK